MRLLFEKGFAPTHAFSAFYRWIKQDFGAHAVLHFGTHGALEFMPGKQTGLSAACWPERLIGADPAFYLRAKIGGWGSGGTSFFSPDAVAEYERCFTSAAIHAMCEDYRASASIDLEHDRADRAAGRKLSMPLMALWGAEAVVGKMFDCLADWREVADDVCGRALPCGHFIPEEAPAETLAEIHAFLDRHPLPSAR